MNTTIILLLCSLLSTYFGPAWLSLPLWCITLPLLLIQSYLGWTVIVQNLAVMFDEPLPDNIGHVTRQKLNPDRIIANWAKQLWQRLPHRVQSLKR